MIGQRNQAPMGRRRVGVTATVVGLVTLMMLSTLSFTAWAQPIDSTGKGEIPTTGGMRPGPVGPNPPTARRRGVSPVAIKIETAQVDSEIEHVDTYVYTVEWTKTYEVAALDQSAIDEIVGETNSEKLTLITCIGTFDPN